MTIGFEELEALNAIMEEGSFRKASEKLHKAQSSISYAIKVLEKELEVEIFDRSTYKPTLTNQGKVIYAKAQQIIAMQRDLNELSKFLKSGIETELTLIVSVIFPPETLLTLLGEVKKEYKQCKLHLGFSSFEKPIEDLQAGKADIVVAGDFTNLTDLEKEFFATIDLIPVRAEAFSVVDFDSAIEVVVGERSLGAKLISQESFEQHETWHVTDYNLKKSIILEALAWGYMPEYLIQEDLQEARLVKIKEKPIEKVNLYSYRKQLKTHGPVNEKIWNELTKSCHSTKR